LVISISQSCSGRGASSMSHGHFWKISRSSAQLGAAGLFLI
jgi:hypothetical protein